MGKCLEIVPGVALEGYGVCALPPRDPEARRDVHHALAPRSVAPCGFATSPVRGGIFSVTLKFTVLACLYVYAAIFILHVLFYNMKISPLSKSCSFLLCQLLVFKLVIYVSIFYSTFLLHLGFMSFLNLSALRLLKIFF